MFKRYVFVLLILFSFAANAQGQEMAARGCKSSELVGTWEMFQLKTKVKRQGRNPFFSKTQTFLFSENGTMEILGSKRNNKSKYSNRENKPKQILSATYSVDKEGTLALVADDPKKSEFSVCSYVLEEVKDGEGVTVFEKGDVNLTYVDPEGNVMAMKGIRKVR